MEIIHRTRMGIPSYFSHVIRKYAKIVRSFSADKVQIHHLKMDCNSIIYDTFYKMEGQFSEARLINEVIANIEKYIREIRPLETVHIAFDGVAPFAKMNQQRTRRYKSHLMTTLDFAKKPVWSTSNITPGTEFMNELSRRVGAAFQNTHATFGVRKVIVSGSDEIGEGEHKLFADVRANPDTTKNVAVYGLDADLIMLSIFHMKYYKNAYIIRETPEFTKSSIKLDREDGLAIMDIGLMCDKLQGRETKVSPTTPSLLTKTPEQVGFAPQVPAQGGKGVVGGNRRFPLQDYVFMCFMLGNDFLPHFPALNIRTHGIATLTDLYAKVIGNHPGRRFISDTDQIQWKNVATFIRELAKMEHPLLLEEYELRDKQDNRFWKTKTNEEREIAFNNLPMMYRQEEKYICPTAPGWETRYYKSLLDGENPTAVAANYLEGLEWVFKYYSGNCPDWQWTYKYNYPPLFVDLQRCVPENETKLLGDCRSAFSAAEQLKYVLFTEQGTAGGDGFPPPKIQWAFCRYFWEAHVDFAL